MEHVKLKDNNEWGETITLEEFQFLLAELFEKKDNFESEKLTEILCALSERYEKFYDDILQKDQEELISSILIGLTEFTNLNRISDLISVMFNFRINSFYKYLVKYRDTIVSDSVKKEVIESIIEYETLLKNTPPNIT